MALYNSSSLIGLFFDALTTNVTGSLFLSMFLIFTLLLMIALAFRLSFELIAIITLPLLIVLAVASQAWVTMLGIVLIALAVYIVRNFLTGD